jgi:hypothetical protein
MPYKSVHGYMSGICPDISIYNRGGGVVHPICPYAEKRKIGLT